MLLYIIICKVLVITMAYGSSDTPGTRTSINQTLSTKSTLDSKNITSTNSNVTVLTEGGAVISPVPELIVPLENLTLHAAAVLDKEYPLTNTKEGNVKPRKGVGAQEPMNSKESKNHTLLVKATIINSNISVTDANNTKLVPVKLNSSTIRPKPKVLSYDEVVKDINSDKTFIAKSTFSGSTMLSSSINMATDYSKHPGMVVPLVITVLVVPMFAVLGYMALKRGQEAWRNRHYKRMDFLLDGMYNE